MIYLKLVASNTQEADSLILRFATPEDYEKSKAKRTINAKQNFLLGRALLRALLVKITGNGNWQLLTGEHGKPYVTDSEGYLGPSISISHSNIWVACTLCTHGKIGVDIECWKKRDFLSMAQYAFGVQEYEAVKLGGEAVFYRIWTLREAMAKATGEGILYSLNGKDAVTYFESENRWMYDTWGLFYVIPHAGYSLAIAIDNTEKVKDPAGYTVDIITIGDDL